MGAFSPDSRVTAEMIGARRCLVVFLLVFIIARWNRDAPRGFGPRVDVSRRFGLLAEPGREVSTEAEGEQNAGEEDEQDDREEKARVGRELSLLFSGRDARGFQCRDQIPPRDEDQQDRESSD